MKEEEKPVKVGVAKVLQHLLDFGAVESWSDLDGSYIKENMYFGCIIEQFYVQDKLPTYISDILKSEEHICGERNGLTIYP